MYALATASISWCQMQIQGIVSARNTGSCARCTLGPVRTIVPHRVRSHDFVCPAFLLGMFGIAVGILSPTINGSDVCLSELSVAGNNVGLCGVKQFGPLLVVTCAPRWL